MAKLISYGARKTFVASRASDALVGLMKITPYEAGSDPIYITTDPATRLSRDPLKYGLKSKDFFVEGEPPAVTYEFVIVQFALPDDSEDVFPSTSIQFDNLDPAIVEAARMSIYPATIDLGVVRASQPDELVERWPAMEIGRASWSLETITLEVSYDPLVAEPLVATKMTRDRCPALFK